MNHDPTLAAELAAMEADATERRASIPPLPEASLRDLLPRTFLDARSGMQALRSRSEVGDDFGYDEGKERRYGFLLRFLYEEYFRVETSGLEHVPAHGRVLLVANHAGTLPLDGLMLRHALQHDTQTPRSLRWLVEDSLFHMPFVGTLVNRLGAVRACQENAERLLSEERAVAVFPEGIKGIGKLYRERYRLQRFGRGGFVKLALRTRTPVLPVAIVGSEETNPLLFRVNAFARRFGVPFIPITPTFPLLGPLGLVPAPTKWRIVVGPPIDFGDSGEAPDSVQSARISHDEIDEVRVAELTERTRSIIQGMLGDLLQDRRSVFRG